MSWVGPQMQQQLSNKGVYWLGQNGNIYVKTGNGNAADFGSQDSRNAQDWDSALDGYVLMDDPNPGGSKVQVSGSGTGTQYADTSAARQATLGQIGSLDKQLDNLNLTAQSQYDQLLGRYNEEDQAAAGEYQRQTDSNENTRSGGISQSLAAAAQGGRGLRSSLAAMGALGGTGSVLANRAVAQSANKDIGGVNETFDTNATNLNTAWSATEQDQRNRKAEASSSLENSKLKNAGSVASQRQNLFRDMASFFEQSGNRGEAANWLSKLSGQNPAIEQAALTKTPEWQSKSAAFSPQALKSYLSGAQDMSVKSDAGNSGLTMNSPLFAQSRRREELV